MTAFENTFCNHYYLKNVLYNRNTIPFHIEIDLLILSRKFLNILAHLAVIKTRLLSKRAKTGAISQKI